VNVGYKDYGYHSADANWSDSYVLPILRRMLGPPVGSVLDVGSGNGSIARALISEGYDVYGIDASRSGIEIANSSSPGRFFLHDLADSRLPDELADRRFAAVISTEVICHLYAPRGLFDFTRGVLVEHGVLIVSAPYHGYLKNLALALSGKLDAHFSVLWDGGFIKFFSRRTLERMLCEQGFVVTEFAGAGRVPYLWKSMLVKARLP
jgi:2-polyprenyl-3-methyl-5-hydroxy-6-metoxy-1,4-benzoquinol methylase